jgi:hypothetical protein
LENRILVCEYDGRSSWEEVLCKAKGKTCRYERALPAFELQSLYTLAVLEATAYTFE